MLSQIRVTRLTKKYTNIYIKQDSLDTSLYKHYKEL
jgi:hypothetical protein